MCGITGFADFTHKSSLQLVKEMASAMPHRGPDGQGAYFKQLDHVQVGLGHRRLSIIDLSDTAGQPMHYDGLTVIFNGEIYNYNEIRNRLIALGHIFKTHSDTEVILHAWREWGKNCIQQWRGMFAIALLDETRGELICIRDRAGVKPFTYYFDGNVLIWGSELKSLLAHPAFRKELDINTAAAYLQYGYVPSPYSIFKNTHKLPAGYILQIDLHTKTIASEQYWNVYDYYNKPKLNVSLPEAIEETQRILEESFQYRMVADVPVGVFLSGGYDSTCVTALLQKNTAEKIKTFTIGTTDDKLNEAPFAKRIAGHLGTDHTEYYCTAQETLNVIPDLPYYYDEPFADSSAIPTILVSRMARKKVTVALSADAGDEIFAGYNRYDLYARYGKTVNKIPASARKLLSKIMEGVPSDAVPVLRNKVNFHSRYDKIKNLLQNPSPGDLLKNLGMVFNNREITALFSCGVQHVPTLHTSTELKEAAFDPISFMMAADYQTYMVDDILQKVDRATMSTSLEGREPFLDQHIIQWAAQLPTGYKYHNGVQKYILKQIVHDYVPREIMERPKSGFAIPLQHWLANDLRDLLYSYINKTALQAHGLFDAGQVMQIVNDFFNGRKEKYLKIWHILMFQMWYEKWMR